jgi:hypothetical protein
MWKETKIFTTVVGAPAEVQTEPLLNVSRETYSVSQLTLCRESNPELIFSVRILVTRAGRPGFVSRQGKRFSLYRVIQTGCGAHTASY